MMPFERWTKVPDALLVAGIIFFHARPEGGATIGPGRQSTCTWIPGHSMHLKNGCINLLLWMFLVICDSLTALY